MKRQKRILILMIFFIILLSNCQSFATNYLEGEIEFSQDYLDYLEIENKENMIAPSTYDIPKNNKTIKNPFRLARRLRSAVQLKYSLKDIIPENMVVKDQSPTNTCWAFASLATLETHLALQDYKSGIATPVVYDFSERHMDYATTRKFLNGEINEFGFNRVPGDLAVTGIPIAYLTNGLGAIAEEEMEFETNSNLIDISEIKNKNVITQVNDIVTFPTYSATDDKTQIIQQMKEHIMNYGAISAQIHSSNFYNYETFAAFCNDTSYKVDHSVAIVGWDDNFSKDKFLEGYQPENDGAWVIRNSLGTSFGDEGYIYVSYEDVNIYKNLIGIENAQTEITYDNIYQYDEFGGYLKYKLKVPKLYLATEFDKKTDKNEYLTQVSIRSAETYTCKVYVNPNGTSKEMKNLKQVELKTGETETFDAGYHTIEFLNPVKITGDKFVIVLEVEGAQTDSVTTMIEVNFGEFYTDPKYANAANHDYDYVTIADEKCFLATEDDFLANDWTATSKMYELTSGKLPNFDTTIKAFSTSKVIESISIEKAPTKTSYIEGQDFDKTGMVVKANYANGESVEITDYIIQNGTNLSAGQTSITILYEDFTTTQIIEVEKNTVESILIKTPPTKTEYFEGENFETSGMEVEAVYKDGTIENITEYMVQDGKTLEKGQTTVTIEYEGVTITQAIIVKANEVVEKTIMSIAVKTKPDKIVYMQNEKLDLTGGIIEILYNDNSTEEVLMTSKDIIVSGFNNQEPGTQTITLAYGNKIAKFDVEVQELPKPENSNFNNMQGSVSRIRSYSFSDKNKKEYTVLNVELNNVVKATENEKVEYYYYLSENPSEQDIENWIKIDELKETNGKMQFEINTLNVSNYEELVDAKEIYLYIKEVAIRNGIESEIVTSSVVLEAEKSSVENYLDGKKVTNIDSTPAEKEDSKEDNTKAPGSIPKTGKDLLMICMAIAIIIIGKVSYSKYKDIQIK